jgi:branched-chain amino acid transport system permease protein
MRRVALVILAAVLAIAAIALLGRLAPGWLNFLSVVALAKACAALGLVVLLRSGLLSFGHGLFYCVGAYGVGLCMLNLGITDATLLVLIGGLAALVFGLALGPLLAGYRGIFFATLTLALSMLLHGALTKVDKLGGSDGLNIRPPTFFGYLPGSAEEATYALLLFCGTITVIVAAGCRLHFDSLRGLLSIATRDNEIRVEYLGASVRRIVYENFVAAAFLGGLGGGMAALAVAHIDPELAYWTTSGEFVFVAILAGNMSVGAVFAASFLLEFIRSFSSQYFPNAWQMALGIFMLLVILFLPDGLGALVKRRKRAPGGAP